MRLLILTQYFPPEMDGTGTRLYELAKRLKDKGHEVTVLTAMPNYPTGRIFKGYRFKIRKTESMDGFKVVRTCVFPSKSRYALPRLLSYLSFVMSSVLLGFWGLGKQDVLLFESPPLFLIPSGLLIGLLKRTKVIMNVSDIWPEALVQTGHKFSKLTLKILLWLEKFGYEHSTVVALTNPGAVERINARFPHIATTIISNGVNTKMFRPDLRSETIRGELGLADGDFLAMYSGLHGLAQGLEVIVDAANRLRDNNRIKFVMVGEGPTKESLVRRADELKLSNLKFLPHRPKKEMPALLASADVSMIPLAARMPGTMPSKIYEAMASSVPVVVAKGCEGEALVNKFDVGMVFEPLDSQELAAAISSLASDPQRHQEMRVNCLEISKRFDRAVTAERTELILLAVAQGKEIPKVGW
jgi:glycosyltransferase involved in cell wall biosynthesis